MIDEKIISWRIEVPPSKEFDIMTDSLRESRWLRIQILRGVDPLPQGAEFAWRDGKEGVAVIITRDFEE
jgi:hypothetical protein